MVAIARSSAAASSSASRSASPTLRLGARGAAVTTLQNQLRAAGFNPGASDGVFGPKTLAAVQAFQRARGLQVDGIAGPKTRGALSSAGATPTLRNGARGAAVTTLQNKLKAAGFNPGAADGVFGPKTQSAVQSFQRARGLQVDGVVGPKTWQALNSAGVSGGSGPTLRNGARGEPVRALQQRLNQLGFSSGTADGVFGPKTLSAVKAFQQSRGLTADGIVGPKTWDKLGINVQGPVTNPGGGGRVVTGYVNGQPRRISLSPVPNGKEMRSDAAAAFNRMHAAARAQGITLKVNSGFRSMAEQEALYRAYKNGTGNLAAPPGYSNHQGGIAVDINTGGTGTSTYRWLANNARNFGFVRTVPSEPWHWEYRP
ncbi:peptidoglycan-binding protein [Corallococcus macrosporus]|uniref:Penicillin-resistant DD-carboxypeptidase n=1 Tax=Myxococcus fulvus (strain ATCC BAA-855 / HW-1) TaxID=483219 RepID=F8C7C4_MYXFH|nr:peptidoglycan-binding protein [Corallococcus macrosporus]AEI63122.1 penicillin-resistant DD-carboxypeptidase [Corallococcus macrosporus]